jgi:type I restriction enzyme M protein
LVSALPLGAIASLEWYPVNSLSQEELTDSATRSKQQPTKSIKTAEQTELKFPTPEDEKLEVLAMEMWLWDAACTIRGMTDAPKFKD